MTIETQKLVNELIHDSATQAEQRMLQGMLDTVQRKRNMRTAIRACSIVLVAALGIVTVRQVDELEPEVEIAKSSDTPAVESGTNDMPVINIIETTDSYVQVITTSDVPVAIIDDNDLDRIFEDRAYAIVDNYYGGRTFMLLGEEGI